MMDEDAQKRADSTSMRRFRVMRIDPSLLGYMYL